MSQFQSAMQAPPTPDLRGESAPKSQPRPQDRVYLRRDKGTFVIEVNDQQLELSQDGARQLAWMLCVEIDSMVRPSLR